MQGLISKSCQIQYLVAKMFSVLDRVVIKMSQDLCNQKDERLFLQELAQQFGWDRNKAKVFEERMFHDEKTNPQIEEDLSLAGNAVSDFFSDYGYPLLEAHGFGDFLVAQGLRKSWKAAQKFLRERMLPEWLKDRIWRDLWTRAMPNGPIELIDETPSTPTGIVTAGVGRRAGKQKPLLEVSVGAPLRYEILAEYQENLILLERDSAGNIVCLSPSSDFPEFAAQEPAGKEEILAVMVDPVDRPTAISWLQLASKDILEIDAPKLQELQSWIQQAQNCRLWQMEFEVIPQPVKA
jgi:hypothetical protein